MSRYLVMVAVVVVATALAGCGGGEGSKTGGGGDLASKVSAYVDGKSVKDCKHDPKDTGDNKIPGESEYVCKEKDPELGWVPLIVTVQDKDGTIISTQGV
jgi:hypothetical protein